MIIESTPLPGLLKIHPDVFGDARGFFQETWNLRRYTEAGLDRHFVQDNLSYSRRGILRGLHFQNPRPQGKLVYVLEGEVFDVAVDVRTDSPTFGQWYGATLSSENHVQLFVPEGFAHGFLTLSDTAEFLYKTTESYSKEHEQVIQWNDRAIGIEWPTDKPSLSLKDIAAKLFSDVSYFD